MGGGSRLSLRVFASRSAGLLTVLEGVVHERGPPLHVHDDEDEVVAVLEGTMTYQVGDERGELAARGLLWFPREVPHASADHSGVPVRFLTVVTPAGAEAFFRAQRDYLAGLAPRTPPDPAALAAVAGAGSRPAVVPPLAAPPRQAEPLPSLPSCVSRRYLQRVMPSREAILSFQDTPPPEGVSPYVDGAAPDVALVLHEYDEAWPAAYALLAQRVRDSLGFRVLELEHVGSTAVPGLMAKPIIDLDLIVADPGREDEYVPALRAVGFVLRVREPWWYCHRMLRSEEPLANLHVWGYDSPEPVRHRIFRDWLRLNA